MNKLRREAIGRVCQIRLDGCNHEPCCLAHWRQMDLSGMGIKADNIFGAWSCHNCHVKVDTTERGNIQTQLDFARAVFRTQDILLREGKISYGTE